MDNNIISAFIGQSMVANIMAELQALEIEYQNHKALILTESDLQCHLFNRVRSRFPNNEPSMDSHITGSAVHSEVKFYNEHNKLLIIPDLTIIDPHDVSIYHSVEFSMSPNGPRYGPLPSKDYQFGGDALVIELKFCRKKGGINSKNVKHYQKD